MRDIFAGPYRSGSSPARFQPTNPTLTRLAEQKKTDPYCWGKGPANHLGCMTGLTYQPQQVLLTQI